MALGSIHYLNMHLESFLSEANQLLCSSQIWVPFMIGHFNGPRMIAVDLTVIKLTNIIAGQASGAGEKESVTMLLLQPLQ